MGFNQNDEKYSKDYHDKISENEDIIKKLNSELTEKNIIISRTKSYLFDLEFDLNNAKNKISSLESNLAKNEIEISSKDNLIQNINSQIENNKVEINNLLGQIDSLESNLAKSEVEISSKDNLIQNINSQIENNKVEINNLHNQINCLENELNQKNKNLDIKQESLEIMEKKYVQQSSKLDTTEYCISCYEEKIIDNNLEIEYLKKNVLIRKFLKPFNYLYLIFKSKPNDISINFKLYKALQNSKCFDIGYYLNNNKDLVESNWCKYFSPELHYVCNGFDEGRKFNKKYFTRDSKKELLDYILKCR